MLQQHVPVLEACVRDADTAIRQANRGQSTTSTRQRVDPPTTVLWSIVIHDASSDRHQFSLFWCCFAGHALVDEWIRMPAQFALPDFRRSGLNAKEWHDKIQLPQN